MLKLPLTALDRAQMSRDKHAEKILHDDLSSKNKSIQVLSLASLLLYARGMQVLADEPISGII